GHRSDGVRQGSSALEQVVVGGGVHQGVEFSRVAELDLEEPAGAGGVGVGQRGVVAQGFVDFGDFAGDGHVDVSGGLHGLDHTGHILGFEGGADGGQVDEHD